MMLKRRYLLGCIILGVVALVGGGWYLWRMPRDSQVLPARSAPLVSAGGQLPATVRITPNNARQIVQLVRIHDGSAMALRASADQRLLAIGMNNVGVAIYDAQTLERLELVEMPYGADQLRTPDGRVAVTTDGKTLAAGLGQIAHIRTANGQLIKLNPFDVEDFAFSPDDTMLATVGEQIRIWRTSDGILEHSFDSPVFSQSSFDATTIVFSPNGTQVFVASKDIAAVLSVADGERIRSFDGAVGAFFPNGDWLATSYGTGTVDIWQLGDGVKHMTLGSVTERVGDVSSKQFATLAVSADGRFVAATAWDGHVRIWRVEDGTLVATWSLGRTGSGEARIPRGLAFTPDATALTVLAGDGTLSQRLLADGSVVRERELASNSVSHLRFSDDSTQLITISGLTSSTGITTWRISDTSVVATQPMSSSLAYEDLYANNNALLTYRNGKPLIWQPRDATAPPTIAEGETWFAGSLSPDGNLLAASTIETNTITLLHVADGSVVRELMFTPEERDGINRVTTTFSADGALLVATNGRTAWVWHVSDGTLVRSFAVLDRDKSSPVTTAVALSPDAKMLATTNYDGVELWNLETGAHLAALASASDTLPITVCFSPDGRLLAIAEYRGAVRLWGVRS